MPGLISHMLPTDTTASKDVTVADVSASSALTAKTTSDMSVTLANVSEILAKSQAMTAKINETRKSMDTLLASCKKTREGCEEALKATRISCNASTELDAKWNEFKAKFDEANKRLIGAIGASLGVDASLLDPGQGRIGMGNNLPGVEELSVEEREAVFGGDISLKCLCSQIKAGKIKNIIIMAGAGISVSAGIPDFRSKNGLYEKLKREYGMTNPQTLFDINYFLGNPRPFTERSYEMLPGKYRPTLTHHFMRLLMEKGILKRLYTQNIDTLEKVAGLPEEKCVFAHGSYSDVHCVECGEQMSLTEWKNCIDKKEIAICQCPKWSQEHGYDAEKNGICGGYAKPDIVFFGEDLPKRFVEMKRKDFVGPGRNVNGASSSSSSSSSPNGGEGCVDCLLVLGTSLAVSPFNQLLSNPDTNVPRVLINNEKVGSRDNLYGGFEFDHEDNYRDLFLEGSCDDTVLEMCRELGWEKELRTLERQCKLQDGWDFVVKGQPKGGNKFEKIAY